MAHQPGWKGSMAEKTRGIKIERSPKRVRAYLAGELVADTRTPFLVWEWPYYPTYYFPADDVRAELGPAGRSTHPAAGTARSMTSRLPGRPPRARRCATPARRSRRCGTWCGWTGTR